MMQEFVQQVKNTVDENLRNVHTAFPGEIVSYDAATGLACVKPKMKYKKPDGSSIDYPQISGVPVVFPQGNSQNATIAFPVKPGDGCLIVVSEQSTDFWMYGQETDTDLGFDITNSICIPGMFAKANPVMGEACSSNSIIISVGGTKITVSAGSVTIDASELIINANVTLNGQESATGDVVAGGVSLISHTHNGDSGGTTSPPM